MTAAFSARRRADEFEALLSRGSDAPVTERDAARFADLLAVVADLHAVPQVAARPEFVASLRESLMAEADTVLVRQPPVPSRLAMPATSRRRERRVGGLLGGVAMVGAAATMAVAAQTALPGESLYGVKRGIESAQVRLSTDDASRGRTLLAQAETRLTELEGLAAGDGGTEQLIPDTLDAFTSQSGDGVRSLLAAYDVSGAEQDLRDAHDFTARSMERLTALQYRLPDGALDELVAAGRTLTDLDMEISSACATCEGGITTVPDFLLTSAPPADLLTGLDPDAVTLEAAPISGQDLTGIEVPDVLASPSVAPTSLPTTPAPSVAPDPPTTEQPDPGKVTDTTTDTTKDVTKGATETTTDLANDLDGATGGALGGLTTDVDDATGGLIGEVTGTLDASTGATLDESTGGLLP